MADKEIKLILTGDSSGMVAATERASQSIKGLNSGTDAVKNSFNALGAVALSSVAGFSAAAMISQLHTAGMASERLKNSFVAATGGFKAGADAMGFVRGEAMRLGLDLQSTADGYMKIAAASKGTALEGQNTQNIFRAVAGASTALGLSAEQSNGALLAISQMMSKGTVQAEELRGQLGERLPGAFQIAARSMGVSTAELGKMLEGGKVIAEDFLPKFAAELEKTFPPGEAAMKGLTAETNRLKTSWFELNSTVMESGGSSMFSGVISGMRAMTDELKAFIKTAGSTGPGGKFLTGLMPGVMYATSIATGAKDKLGKTPGPLSAFDKNLTSFDYSSVGPSGGASYLLGSGANIMSPARTITGPTDAELKEWKTAHKKHREVTVKLWTLEHDLLFKNIQGYDRLTKDQYTLLSEQLDAVNAGVQGSASAFGLMTSQTGDLKTSRYNVTALKDYRLMTNKQYSLPNASGSIEPDYALMAINKERAAASMSGMNSQLKGLGGDYYGAGLDQIDKDRAKREEETAKFLDQGVIMVEEANRRKLLSDKIYAESKEQLDKDTAERGLASLGNTISSLGDTLMQGNKDQFEAGKSMAIAGAGVSMTLGAIQAYTSMTSIPYVGPALGAVAAAAVMASGMANIARIESQHYEAREMGGPVRAGQSYIVGEKRPELFTPGASGMITPYVPEGGGASVTQVLQISAGVPDAVRAEMARMMPLLRQQAVSAVMQAQRAGAMQ